MPEAFRAFQIRETATPAFRSALEARILTGAGVVHVAACTGVDASVALFYHDAFFDVFDRLGARDLIVQQVLLARPPVDAHGLRDLVWKLLAYAGGAEALDAALHGPDLLDRPVPPQRLLGGLLEGLELTAHQAAAQLAATAAPGNVHRARTLQALAAAARAAVPQGATGHDEMVEGIRTFLMSLPWKRINPSDPFAGVPDEIRKFEERGIGLRAEERLKIRLGGTLDNEEELLSAHFPDRPPTSSPGEGAPTESPSSASGTETPTSSP